MPSAATLRRRLVEELALEDAAARAAFLAVPRERFVPGVPLDEVYRDDVVIVKRDEHGMPISSSSQPQIMARMLELLELAPGLRVLEIGAGTGYNAALLKEAVGPRGTVVTVDVDEELARSARRRLREGGHRVRVVAGDGRDGWAAGAPYDRLIATVSTDEVPRAWRDQLREGGLLVAPLRLARGEQAVFAFRREGARLVSVAAVPGGFMPLRGTTPEPQPALYARGPGGSLAQLAGPGVARLSQPAQRRVLTALLDAPRIVPLPPLPRFPLRFQLALTLPNARYVESFRHGIGALGRGGVAFADTAWAGTPIPPTRRLFAFGAPDAERFLLKQIERWRERGCPGPERLRLAVDFTDDGSRIVRA